MKYNKFFNFYLFPSIIKWNFKHNLKIIDSKYLADYIIVHNLPYYDLLNCNK